MVYDVAIIGGGPAGYTAAERASSNGLKVILFEKNAIGGVCLNEGCIPTKTLLYSAKTLDSIKNSSKYGVNITGDAIIDLPKIIARKNKVVRKLSAGIRMRLTEHNVETIIGEASLSKQKDGTIEIICDDKIYSAKNVILSTGSETIIPSIPGLSECDYWTSREALDCKELPESLIVIGGGVIGIEFAAFFNSLGTKVTVVEMMSEILGVMDDEISSMLRNEYTKKGIAFHLSSKVEKVTPNSVVVEKDGEQLVIEADKILVSVGRSPSIKNIGVENLNLELFNNKGVKVNEFMQTSCPNVYACGDITGHSLLAHTAVREAEVAINHILKKEDEMCYKAIPSVLYTNPEFAGVGKTENQLQNEGTEYTVLKLPMAFSGRFVAENEMANGLCKILINKNRVVIGCHLYGNPASELIVVAGLAIQKEFTVEEFQKIVFPHPTVGEIFHETLFA